MSRSVAKPKMIFGFDSLRFLAIALVVVYHCFSGVLPGGFIAVEIFFVLSGFLIGQKLIREKKRAGKKFGTFKGFWKFFVNRITRFLPALLFCIILTLTLAYFADPDMLTRARPNTLYAATFTTNIMSIINGTSYETALIPNLFNQTWFLALELQLCLLFYALMAVYYRVTAHYKMKAKKQYNTFALLCLVLSVVSFALMGVYGGFFGLFDRAYFGIDSHAGAFLAGAVLAMYLEPKTIKTPRSKLFYRLLILLSTAGLVTMSVFINFKSALAFFLALPLSTVISLVMIFAILKLQTKRESKLLKPFEYLGSLSYFIYLFHWGLFLLLPKLFVFLPAEIVPFLAIIFSIILAILTKHVIMPFSKKHKIIFAILLILSLILPVMSLIKAPDQSSIEESLAAGAEVVEENKTGVVASQAVKVDYSGIAGMAKVFTNDTMKFFDATENFAKPYPAAVIYGGGGGGGGRAKYNTPNYSIASRLSSARVMVIGDSVVLGATNAIYNTVPGAFVDAMGSRNMYDAINLVAGYRAANGGTLPRVIVIGLITNYCSFGTGTLQQIMDAAGPGHQFVFVTGYLRDSNRDAQNNTLRWAANAYGNVRVADWVPLAAANPSYLYADGIHLTPAGRTAYANLVNSATRGL